jgi:LasA protease
MRILIKIIWVVFILLLITSCSGSLWGSYESDETRSPEFIDTNTISPLMRTATAMVIATEPTYRNSSTETNYLGEEITHTPQSTIVYKSQSGESLEVVAIHFGVDPDEITSSVALPDVGFLTPDTMLFIPNRLLGIPTTPVTNLLPDSEIVYGPSAVDFDISKYIESQGGFLYEYKEYLAIPGWISGAGSIQRLAFESSINPRFLLVYLQLKSGWVLGEPLPGVDEKYPLGYKNPFYQGLYQELRLLVQELDAGYYGWRSGDLTELQFNDGITLRIAPSLNAGTVAIQYLLSQHLDYIDWLQAVDPQSDFIALYSMMFGDPWGLAELVEPSFPPGLLQPVFSFPFEVGIPWTFTGGPHPAWEKESALAALDFAPPSIESGCVESVAWVVAITAGQIVRSGGGYVVLDLDGDGFEQTGWVVLYLHVATKDRITAGTWVNEGDHIGHPSCEGGKAYGTHLHIARKYNGEWVGAGGALPFVLSGWTTHQGERSTLGTLTKGDKIIISSSVSSHESLIFRQPGE